MECINFDEKFERYAVSWMRANADTYRNNLDAMEAKMPDVYARWLKEPQDWLEGAMPGQYFERFGDADQLVEWMLDYFREKVPVPDQLLERITALGGMAEEALCAVLSNGFQLEEARLTAISLLSEMGSTVPMVLYIDWIAARKEKDDLADLAAEALVAMGKDVIAPILAKAPEATPWGQETFADVLCNFPGVEGIYELTLSLFHTQKQKRTLFASLLSKLGDARALPALEAAARERPLSYLEFVELRNAIEALGGDAPEAPDFSGDPHYESLRRME